MKKEAKEHPLPLILGIDLGTTNSLIALCDERGPQVLHRAGESPLVPSVVRLGQVDHSPLTIVGKPARDSSVQFPTETVSSIKRFMGRSMKDVQPEMTHVGFSVVEGAHDTARIRVGARIYSPQEISAMILGELKSIAEDVLKTKVSKAVITVPAYFDDAQRQATRDAGRFAGLEVVRVINEPTAAALAYGIGTRKPAEPETIAVYDLGGGTFDISILQIIPPETDHASPASPHSSGEAQAYFQVLSTAGDTHLGGDDVDMMIIDLVKQEIAQQFGTEMDLPASTRQALRLFAESTKIRLSHDEQANLQVDIGANRRYTRTITRTEFEEMIRPWVERTLEACRRALTDAKRTPAEIDRVVMVGGSTRIPLVRQLVGQYFEATPYTALDPDQVVALGAAVQAAMLSGASSGALLLDVIPLSLGIETMGGAVAKLIMRNSTVPCSATERFSTSVDGQTRIRIHVLQGERELVSDCRSLGQFDLRGIPPMPAGIPQLEVTFHVDVNGVLDVSAIEKRSGKRAAVQILPSHGLTREEVDAIEAASYIHAREDLTTHRIIDLRVNSALDIKWINEALARVRSDLEPAYLKELDTAVARLQSFVDESEKNASQVNADAFHEAKENLDRVSMHMHEVAITRSLKE